MPFAVLIVGLCGSGKSHFARELAQRGYVCLDESFEGRDFAADIGSPLSTDKFNELVKQLGLGKDCAFTEAMLMFERNPKLFEPSLKKLQAMPGVTVEWVFFTKDLDAANHNCLNDPNRTDGLGRAKLNNDWIHHYTIPAGHNSRPITRIPEKKEK